MHFLLYWTPPYAREALAERYRLQTLTSAHLRRVSVGDVVWVVSATRGRLSLIGRLAIDRMTAGERGPRACAKARQGERMRDVPLNFAAVAALRFAGTERDRLDCADGVVHPQQLQTMRRLTPASARLLARRWRARSKRGRYPMA